MLVGGQPAEEKVLIPTLRAMSAVIGGTPEALPVWTG
jgi:hypothetical protein